MALESFYGGKPGYSPIIKSTFKYISEDDTRYQNLTSDQKTAALRNHEVMNSCFQDPTYTDVWYGELCIIASDSMYDSNNGKIFRRTLKKQSSEDELYSNLYAEYLGQIVGMPGGLPKVVFTKIDDIKTKAEAATNDIWYPTGIETGSNFIQTSNQPITDSSNYPYVFQNSEGIELVPGKDKNGNYNDNFEYTWLQVLNPETNSNNSESDGTAATIDIGVKIPYLTIEPEAKSISYTNGANALIEETNIVNGIEHPFYRKYTFSIPDGVRGIGIRNLRIETKASLEITGRNNIVLDPSQNIFNYDEDNREITIIDDNEENYYDFDEYQDNSPFWVYDLIVPRRSDLSLNPTSHICYAGDYNEVANVELSNDGTLIFNRNYGDPISTTSKLKWITNTSIDTDIKSINSETGLEIENTNYGKFTINYNEGNNSENYILPLVKKVIVSPNINNKGETINVDLATSGNRAKRLTLQKEVTSTDDNNPVSYTDYILKYPTKVNIRSAIIDTEDPENSEDDHFFYLTATYNDSTVENLGKVGLTNVSHLGYTLGIKELDSTLYFPNMAENLIPDSPILIKEEINFNIALDFPSFSVST